MVKIFVTGDNHFGISYGKFNNVNEKLSQSRLDSFNDMIKKANEESCDFFVVTGDLFHKVSVNEALVKTVLDSLAKFNKTVIVIPGNHDYLSLNENGAINEKVWLLFKKNNCYDNIYLTEKYEKLSFKTSDNKNINFYPAFCDSERSETNKLDFVKNASINQADYNVLLSHGALEGLSLDKEGRYFYMKKSELENLDVDCCLIGHTHVPYPENLKEDEYTEGFKIFNAGIHEQEKIKPNNKNEGICFIIELDKKGKDALVLAKKFVSGKVKFFDLKLNLAHGAALRDEIDNLVKNLNDNSVIRIYLSGAIEKDEYKNREEIYKEILARFIAYRVDDDDLCSHITKDDIRENFAETSFVARFLEEFIDDSKKLQMAYDLVSDLRKK